MRITTRQYAEALYGAVNSAEVSARSGIVDRFLVRMVRDRRRRDISLVFRHIERIAERETGVKSLEIVSARPLSEASLDMLKSEGEKIFGTEKISFTQKIEPAILGGVKFQTEHETFDASARGRLRQLKSFLQEGI